ncbi:MAG: ABC transporter permease [Melioribacteraceae bacterium]|nr:ABC transporter permease [Melioribacteraceae bacterium]
MKNRLNILFELLKREIKIILKDKDIFMIILIAPLFYSFFYGSIYFNKSENNIPFAIVDYDNSISSQKLIRMIDATSMIEIKEITSDPRTAQVEIEAGNISGYLLIPKDFESSIKSKSGVVLNSYLNTTRFLISNDLNKAINETVADFNKSLTLKYYYAKGINKDAAQTFIEPVATDIRSMFNTTDSYGDFLIPAILILILQQTLFFALAESIAKENEFNTLRDYFSLAKNKVNLIIHGKSIFYLLISSSYALFFFTIVYSVFNVPFRGNAFVFASITLLLLLTVIYYSLFVASFFKRKILALQFLTLTSYPIFLISGYSWRLDSMPLVVKWIAYLIPSTPFYTAFVRVVQMGAGFNDILPEIAHLIILLMVSYLVLYFRMKSMRKSFLNDL